MSLFVLGDRVAGSDPSTLLFGTGALAGTAAVLGAVFGRLGGDRAANFERIRPVTFGLRWDAGGSTIRGESIPQGLSGTFAPNLRFRSDDGRVRLFGRIGGDLGVRRDVDPRPQLVRPEGEAPLARRSRGLDIDLGLDWAVTLPYPVLSPRRSPWLGRVELRFRPEVRIRRDTLAFTGAEVRTIERIMLLPLTVGIRWHLSPRQRFTFYVGPRFDFTAYAVGDGRLHRGRAVTGPIHGEAWYDLHVPLERRANPRVQGLFTLGYVHSRFDGQGLNPGPVIGFLGPLVLQWSTRVRPRRSPVAYQGMLMATVGSGYSLSFTAGVVLPDLRVRGRG